MRTPNNQLSYFSNETYHLHRKMQKTCRPSITYINTYKHISTTKIKKSICHRSNSKLVYIGTPKPVQNQT